jgi:hypothetical protein
MAIPSGTGTEVLKRVAFYALQSSSGSWNIINGVADHIYTLLSVVICNRTASATTVSMYGMVDGSGQFELIGDGIANIPAQETFVWNDKVVLTGTDHLQMTNSGSHVDVWVSYIDQDWT